MLRRRSAAPGGVHVFVADDRDAAAYLLNDLYGLLDEQRVLFFPSSYKRSVVYGAEDAQGVVQRTAALNALRTSAAGYLVLCTYPEALAERVVDGEALRRETMTVRAGDRLRPSDLVEWLEESGFQRVDFVYEPGSFAARRDRRRLLLCREPALPLRLFRRGSRLDPALQHLEPVVAGQVAAGGDHPQPQCARRGAGVVR